MLRRFKPNELDNGTNRILSNDQDLVDDERRPSVEEHGRYWALEWSDERGAVHVLSDVPAPHPDLVGVSGFILNRISARRIGPKSVITCNGIGKLARATGVGELRNLAHTPEDCLVFRERCGNPLTKTRIPRPPRLKRSGSSRTTPMRTYSSHRRDRCQPRVKETRVQRRFHPLKIRRCRKRTCRRRVSERRRQTDDLCLKPQQLDLIGLL